jgi:shikimate 5-dehydrogenase/3-dehydroquinate dehydratase
VKLFVTILEETADAAVDAIRALRDDHDGIEVRAENFPSIDLHAIRAATSKPIILTYRGARVPDVAAALNAGIDFVDAEWHEGVEVLAPERTVLSHHDYEGMRDIESIVQKMQAHRCAHTKLAATPQNFADNERLLELIRQVPSPRFAGRGLGEGRQLRKPSPLTLTLSPRSGERGLNLVSVIGMGERGLYSRILAPFQGSELTFVAGGAIAAPGQLTLARALEIYGSARATLRAEKVFAVVGNPAGHSLSPSIHNALFREKGVTAAYTIASIERFAEISSAFLRGEPCGLSVTAPFKDDAFAFASAYEIHENARRAKAVNTLVNVNGRIFADNTDVDGFAALLPHANRAAVIGAGGTARAARVALENAGISATTYNRTASKGDAPLESLKDFDGDLIINTLPSGVDVAIPPCDTYIEAAYGSGAREVDAKHHIGGLELLHAQAVRQHELFMQVFHGL